MARLILLNGPPGIGKSTLARRWVDDHPGVLNLDVDQLRTLIGGWREDFVAVGEIVRPLAMGMAATHLAGGRDVIAPQFLDELGEIRAFAGVARSCGAGFLEVVLKRRLFYHMGSRPGKRTTSVLSAVFQPWVPVP